MVGGDLAPSQHLEATDRLTCGKTPERRRVVHTGRQANQGPELRRGPVPQDSFLSPGEIQACRSF